MAIITSGITTLTDLNDAIISGTQPVNPIAGTLWIDSSKSPAVLKIYKNGAWVTQDLDLNSLDPNMAESIRNVVATIGNMSNDNLLDFQERQQIKDDLTEILGKVMLDTETVLPTVSQLDTLAKGSFYSTRRNALNAGIETNNPIYVDVATQYQNLKTYLESLTPIKPWNVAVADGDKNITVIKDTFRDKWLQYYLATEKLNLATTEKIKEAQEELDGKIDEVSLRDKTEILSGNPVFTDKSDDAVVHVEVDGKSEQNTSVGNYNMITTALPEKELLERAEVVATYSKESDSDAVSGEVSKYTLTGFTGANTGTTARGLYLNAPYRGLKVSELAVGDILTFSFSMKSSRNLKLRCFANSLENVNSSALNTTTNWQKFSFTFRVADLNGLNNFHMFSNGEVWQVGDTQYIHSVKIERGSTATPIPIPSLDYPSAINSLDRSFDIVSSVGKENLLPENPTVTGEGKDVYTVRTPILKDLTYTVSFDAKSNSGRTIGTGNFFYSPNSTTSSVTSTGSGGTTSSDGYALINVTTEEKRYWITWTQSRSGEEKTIILGRVVAGANISISNVKLQSGSVTETPLYTKRIQDVEYNTKTPTLYKTNILLSEPLRSIGDVKDRVFRDSQDSLWKVERKIGERVFDGTETGWEAYSTTKAFLLRNPFDGARLENSKVDNSLSSHFSIDDGGTSSGVADNEVMTQNNSNIFVGMRYKFSTVTLFTNWLQEQKTNGTPLTHQYRLATPTIETLSAEQQTKLNNIQSFKGSNYVYTMANVEPNLNAVFKSNAWYRTNVLGEQLTYGNRNWARNGNLAYLLEDSAWSGYYKGTVREIVDISSDAPPFKNALHIKQTTSGIAGIIDAVIWEGAEANVLTGQSISMATWLKYQNVANSDLVMQVQVTGKKSDGTFVYDYPKVFSSTGTDMTWQRRTGTVKINLFEGATEITRVMFRLGFAKAGTGEFWATGIQLETGTALGDWSANPDDVQGDLDATKAQLILTEKEVALRVAKGNVVNEVNVDPTGVRIKGKKFTVDADTEFNANLTMNKGVIKSADGGTVLDLNNNTLSLDKPFSIGNTKSATVADVSNAQTAINADIKSVTDTANSLKDFTNTAFSDGIIQIAEAQAISEHLNTLLKENEDLSSQYVGIYGNTSLTGTPKTNLYNSKIAYNTAYTNIVSAINNAISGNKTTPAQKADVDAKFITYTTALKTLTLRMNEAMTVISETLANAVAVAKANLAEVNAKAHADGKVTAEETRAINDAEAKLVQAQAYADNISVGGNNLVKNSETWGLNSNNNTLYPILQETITDGEIKFLRVKPHATTGNGILSVYETLRGSDITDKNWKGRDVVFSLRVRSNALDRQLEFDPYVQTNGKTLYSSKTFLSTTGNWQVLTGLFKNFPYDLADNDIIRFMPRMETNMRGYQLDIRGYQIEFGNKATNDWSPASADFTQAITQAQTDAKNAKDSATTANQLLADLSNDGILTPVEKKSVKKEWDIIVSEKTKIDAEATEYGITTGTERTNYNTHYNSLNGYIPPLLANLNINSNIVGVNFRGYFKNYYDARQDILNAITSKAKALADSAQGTADTVKGVVSNFDSSIINANPIFLDWTGQYPAGYSGITSSAGSGVSKAVSNNGMGNAVKYTVLAGSTGVFLTPSTVTTAPFYEYATVEFTFKLESGTIDGAGVLFRYIGNGNTDHRIHIKDSISSPTLNKWYTVTKTIKQSSIPAGFTGYQVYPMAGWNSFGSTITAKVIQYDSLKSRQATEQEINAYESNIMISDMSSDSKITPVEKVQLKKEWATIASERASLDGLAGTYNLGAEKTNMTNAYNTLSSALNGTNGILANMTTTSTVVATTFRAQFDDYYEKKAILQKRVSELAKSIADSKTSPTEVNDSILADKKIKDTRSTNQSPEWYFSNYSMQEIREFKQTATMGIGTGEGTYGVLTTNVPWNGNSGGSVKQSFVVGTKTYKRNGTTTSWTAWKDYDGTAELAESLANDASKLAGTKAETYTSTPTIPYKSGDVWKNGTAVYISTVTRASGSFTSADWVLVGDVTSNNTAKDVTNVGGTLATTIRDRATNGNTAYASTSLWKTVGKVTFDGGNLEADTITSGAIISDVGIINKLFASDANVNALTAKTAFINTIKSIDLSADRISAGTITGVNGSWNLNTGIMNFKSPTTGDELQLSQGQIKFTNGAQTRFLNYNAEGLQLTPGTGNTGTSKNTSLYLFGGGVGSHQYIQFVSGDGISQRITAVDNNMILFTGNGGRLHVRQYGKDARSGTVQANSFVTDGDNNGANLTLISNTITTPRYGTHNIYIKPQGTGIIHVGDESNYYNIKASTFLNGSSREYKTNIVESTKQGLTAITSLKVVEYNLKKDLTDGVQLRKMGLISEDSLLMNGSDPKAIDLYELSAYSVKAIQEASAITFGHEVKLNQHELRIQELEKRIKQLEEEK